MDRKQENGFPVSTDSSEMHWHNGVTGNLQGTHRMCNIKANSVRETHQTHQKAKRSQDPLMGRGIPKKKHSGQRKGFFENNNQKKRRVLRMIGACRTRWHWPHAPGAPGQQLVGGDNPHRQPREQEGEIARTPQAKGRGGGRESGSSSFFERPSSGHSALSEGIIVGWDLGTHRHSIATQIQNRTLEPTKPVYKKTRKVRPFFNCVTDMRTHTFGTTFKMAHVQGHGVTGLRK